MTAIYSENDPRAVAWLRELERHGHIARGTVDDRSITDLDPADVAGHGQRHFFAGIAGWSLALRLAGVRDDASVWTGSCPCQPFSIAGNGGGFADERHLWPVWFELIRQCGPPIVFGEQVASKDGLAWLDAVFADMEGAGYACAAADLCAASIGAPHIRQRLYFVAYADGERLQELRRVWVSDRDEKSRSDADGRGEDDGIMADSEGERRIQWIDGGYAGTTYRAGSSDRGRPCVMGDPDGGGFQRNPGSGMRQEGACRYGADGDHARAPSPVDWRRCEWIPCSDGKSRPIEPGTQPLVAGLPGRVGLLRGYGNAIVPALAAEFVMSALESIP